MRFSKVVFLTVCVLMLTPLLFSQQESRQQVSAGEMTLEPFGEGISDSNEILTQRMIDRRNQSFITGSAKVLPQLQFWILSARINVWKNFIDVDFFLGGLFVEMSFVPPYEYCKDFKVFVHWLYGTTYGFNTWSYPTGSCM